jgi:C2H2 type zinc finger protein
MLLRVRLRRKTVDRDDAFDGAFWGTAVVRLPERCPYCGRSIRHPSNLARHVRAKHLSPRASDDRRLARPA